MSPLDVALGLGLVVGLAGSGLRGALALLLLPVVLGVADVAAVLVALLLGLDLRGLRVGAGRLLRSTRVRHVAVAVHAVPVGLGWDGRVRGRRHVRLRFALAHLTDLLVLLGAAAALARRSSALHGLALAVLVLVVTSFRPWTDGQGRAAAGRSLLQCFSAPDEVVARWWQTRAGGAAFRASSEGRHDQARALAEAALAADPSDLSVLDALAVSAEATGDPAASLRATELAWRAAGSAPDAVTAGNYAWSLARAQEAGLAPADWSARAEAALAEVDRRGGDGWQVDSTRALVAVHSGRPADALPHLDRSVAAAVGPDDRASQLLTLALARSALGDADGARAALIAAEELSPAHPRLPAVLQRTTAGGGPGRR